MQNKMILWKEKNILCLGIWGSGSFCCHSVFLYLNHLIKTAATARNSHITITLPDPLPSSFRPREAWFHRAGSMASLRALPTWAHCSTHTRQNKLASGLFLATSTALRISRHTQPPPNTHRHTVREPRRKEEGKVGGGKSTTRESRSVCSRRLKKVGRISRSPDGEPCYWQPKEKAPR